MPRNPNLTLLTSPGTSPRLEGNPGSVGLVAVCKAACGCRRAGAWGLEESELCPNISSLLGSRRGFYRYSPYVTGAGGSCQLWGEEGCSR